MTGAPEPRKGMPSPKLNEEELRKRFLSTYSDPAFDAAKAELDMIASIAWDGYSNSRKSPRTEKAGRGYANPDYELSIDWIQARLAIDNAQEEHDNAEKPPCILIVNCAARSEHTCPGEMSKSWRLLEIAQEICGVRNRSLPAGVDKIAALAYVAARTRRSALLAAAFKD